MEVISAFVEDGRTAAILESLDVGAVVLDLNENVMNVNELAALILDIPKNELIGRSFFALGSTNPRYVQMREALERAQCYPPGEQQSEVCLHLRGRDHVYIVKLVQLSGEDAGNLGTFVTMHDVTYLRDKDRARTNLIATLSNELKTPLTSLALGVELLQRKTLNSQQLEIVSSVVEDLERIRDLSEGLLSVSHEEPPSIAVRSAKFQLAKLAAWVAKRFVLQASQKEIALHVQADDEIESYGDPLKIAWVISNLVSNALRYTPEGGSIEVSVNHIEKIIRLCVTVSGAGIPRDLIEVVFERGEQWTAEESACGPAVLDLAIAREIIEAHGGRIFFESTSRGSSFTVDLPHFPVNSDGEASRRR